MSASGELTAPGLVLPGMSTHAVGLNGDAGGLLLPLAAGARFSLAAPVGADLLPIDKAALSGGWYPTDLGADLFDGLDAEALATMNIGTGNRVSEFRTVLGGSTFVQATDAARPVWGVAVVNGRPGLTFAGAQEMTFAGTGLLPTGSTVCEIWVVFDNPNPGSLAGVQTMFTYGGNAAGVYRRLYRNQVGALNNLVVQMGTGVSAPAATNSADIAGVHWGVGECSASLRLDVDGSAGAVVPTNAPATGTTRTRLGARNDDTPTNFLIGDINSVWVTKVLTGDNRTAMLAFMAERVGGA